MQQRSSLSASLSTGSSPIPVHFGAHLRLLRDRHGLSQAEIVKHLDTWQQAAYSKVEKGTRAPLFEQLEPIYRALKQAGVQLTIQDREHFYLLARALLESRQRRHAHRSENEWNGFYVRLAAIDGYPITKAAPPPSQLKPRSRMEQTPRREVGHLLGREAWLASLIERIVGPSPMKVLILKGPPGCGKTSELHRLAHHFLQHIPRYFAVISEPSPIQLGPLSSTDILEQLLEDILGTVGPAYAMMPTNSLQARVNYILDALAKADHPVVIGFDNAEHIFDADGNLENTWQSFLIRFAQASHEATLIVASQEWPISTFLEESQLVNIVDVPVLSEREGSQLLQTLGLRNVPEELLLRAVDAVGGMPICIEWMVRLVREPYLRDAWTDEFEEADDKAILAQLLDDPAIFGGAVAQRVQPLLERVLKRLSHEATAALQDLAVSLLPLGAPALKALYQSPRVLRELREASLLAAYPQRVQLVPMVAALMRKNQTAEQIHASEERLMPALTTWLSAGIPNTREQGVIFTELACLLIRHHRLLDAAEFILYHGWLSSHIGQIQRLARLVHQILAEYPQTSSEATKAPESAREAECGALLLHNYLAPYRGEQIAGGKRRKDYERIYAWVQAGQVKVEPLMEVHLVDHLMLNCTDNDQYEEAQRLLDDCFARLASSLPTDKELHATLISKRASFYSEWSGYAESQGDIREASLKRVRAIKAYEESITLLQDAAQEKEKTPLQYETLKKKQASSLNNLAYHLNRAGRFAEALQRINVCIDLKQQGYADPDSLAASYGEKSQIQAALGEFQEALRCDELARSEIGRSADAGDTRSQADRWIYQVNQARLYLLIGRDEEAEDLLREVLPIKTQRRKVYKVLAEESLKELERAKAASPDGRFQLDWRWVGRYRTLSAYDAYWWWAPAGPFTDEEQDQWAKRFTPRPEEGTKEQLRALLLQSRERELDAARAAHREPRLSYPALDIVEVRQRIADFLQLDTDITEQEPNVVVRRLYHGAIEDEVCFLRLIEATSEGNTDHFWELIQGLYPQPTRAEMQYALEQVRQVLLQGLQQSRIAPANAYEQGRFEAMQQACQQMIGVLREQFSLSFDLSEEPSGIFGETFSPPDDIPEISAQGAKRFFEAVLEACGYHGWQITLDPNVAGPRVESGLRQVFLPAEPIPLDELREYVSHELAGHVARSIAGEQSIIGLLGMGTKGYLVTEEGIADYYERQATIRHGDPVDDSGIWLGTLAAGLAGGVAGPPQTFASLLAFFEPLLLAYRLLWRDNEDRALAERRARRNAFTRCLRTFRGVPNLEQPGVCNTKDVVYLRGRWIIDQAVAQDPAILDRLAVGKIAYELLPELEQLGMSIPTPSFQTLITHSDLDAYILSFDRIEGDTKETEVS